MQPFLSQIRKREKLSEYLFRFGCIMIIPGFIYSKALTTACIVTFVISGLLHFNLKQAKKLVGDFQYALHTLVFIGTVITGWNSTNINAWMNDVIIKLPFLVLPIGFFLSNRLTISFTSNIHLWLLAVLSISAIPQFIYIGQHHEALIDALSKGQPILTPIEHVKYSMINAYGVISACYLLLFRPSVIRQWRKPILLGIIIVFILMHLLAVRTGLVILYSSLLVLGITYAIKEGSKKIWIALLSVSLAAPMIAYKTIPTIQQKVNYMIYDYKMYKAGSGQEYSDSQRWIMLDAGINIWKQNPVLGIGNGDIRDASYQYYNQTLNLTTLKKIPHNQFLIVMMGGGIVGLIIFLIGLYGPLWNYKGEMGLLLGLLYFNYTLSFLVENSLERSVSVGFFLFFCLLIISTRKSM